MQDKHSQDIKIAPLVANAAIAAIKHIDLSPPWLTFSICV